MSVAKYIMQLKLKKASYLLANTGYEALADISNRNFVSSQSHFI